jgi:hypothetical protein
VIVRILGDRQYKVPDGELPALEALDEKLNVAIEANDEKGVEIALAALIAKVRSAGLVLDENTLVPSDLTVPHDNSTLEDILELLSSEPETDPVTEGA